VRAPPSARPARPPPSPLPTPDPSLAAPPSALHPALRPAPSPRCVLRPRRCPRRVQIANGVAKGAGGVKSVAGKVRFAAVNNVTFAPAGAAPKLPTIGGSEGAGVVSEVGSGVADLDVGDLVNVYGTGVWSTEVVADAASAAKLPNDIPVEAAATMSAPGTALALLENFATLNAGDVIIQNDAASTVGQAVIQLAKAKGVTTINVVNALPPTEYSELVARLHGLGADIVVPAEYVHTAEFDALLADVAAPVLALDAQGGRDGANIARRVASGATMVMHGGAAGEVVTLPTEYNVKFESFVWEGLDSAAVAKLAPLIASGEMNTWLERHSFSSGFAGAVQACDDAENTREAVLVMDDAKADQALVDWYKRWAGPNDEGSGRW
jgi:NADPH:quinone reductase-like Zn-dependent oxidoreductase